MATRKPTAKKKSPAKKKAFAKRATAKKSAPKKKKAAPKRRSAPRAGPTWLERAGDAELQKVAFTLFNVTDFARARAFYENTLGLTRGIGSENGMWTEYDLPGGGCLALFFHPNPQLRGKTGGASIALEVRDLDAIRARLQPAGVQFLGDIIHGPHCRMQNIVDSEGNMVILHELNEK
jgi:predicted enzyme related to lactoylglutathione lyase